MIFHWFTKKQICMKWHFSSIVKLVLLFISSKSISSFIFIREQYDTRKLTSIINLFTSLIFIFIISHRHSLSSTSLTIKSEIKGHNVWVMHYKTTRWNKSCLHLSLMSIFIISHRHSLNYTSETIKSELQGHNIWVICYKIIRWNKPSPHHNLS
jgi:hypothetical protein